MSSSIIMDDRPLTPIVKSTQLYVGLLFSVFYLCFGHTYCSIFVCQSVLNGLPYLFYKGGIKEKPLVLHSKVKSSGYTSSPR